jgi:hypothetical protein
MLDCLSMCFSRVGFCVVQLLQNAVLNLSQDKEF